MATLTTGQLIDRMAHALYGLDDDTLADFYNRQFRSPDDAPMVAVSAPGQFAIADDE